MVKKVRHSRCCVTSNRIYESPWHKVIMFLKKKQPAACGSKQSTWQAKLEPVTTCITRSPVTQTWPIGSWTNIILYWCPQSGRLFLQQVYMSTNIHHFIVHHRSTYLWQYAIFTWCADIRMLLLHNTA